MNRQNRSFRKMSGVVLLLLISLSAMVTMVSASATAVPVQAPLKAPLAATLPLSTCTFDGVNTRTCDLWATTGTLTLPDRVVTIWGYTDTATGTATLPGPAIVVNEGETVVINLTNLLAEQTSMSFPGQSIIPDLTGVAANGGTTTYTFTASNPGTYLYEAGLIPGAQHQVPMGLFGALVVRPSAAPTQAYNDPATAFDQEAVFVLSEIDPALHANPTAFDLRYFKPAYKLINGQAYPDIVDTAVPMSATGSKVLLRYINAGIQQHAMGTLGITQEVIAINGSKRPYAYTVASETIGPGFTSDRLVTIPATAGTLGTTRYAIYDTSMDLVNNGLEGVGGMLTFLTVTDGPPPVSGPTTSAIVLSPPATNGLPPFAPVTLSATISGSSTITAAEYFVDATGADGTGCPIQVAANTGTIGIIGVIPASGATPPCTDLAVLAHGDHKIYVHGADATAWGSFNFANLHVDKIGPETTGLNLAPNPSNGSQDVNVTATGNDSLSGNSNISAVEFFIGPPTADGTGTPMTVNIASPIASASATIPAATMTALAEGAHTLSVHSMDSFGFWGPFTTTTLAIDRTGPVTSNVIANPNPNNGSTPYSPTVAAIRVDATLADLLSPDVNSSIQRAEGFINTVGADGTGFPLSPRDGLFDTTVENAYVYIPLSTISPLGVGTHTIYIHGQDASGNWGAATSVDLIIETDIPTVTGTAVTPNTTDGTVLVALTATATDPSSDIVLAEWFTGADPGVGNGTAMAVSFNGVDWDLSATIDATGWAIGDHTLSVRARDAAGNWSPTDSTILSVTQPILPLALAFSTSGSGAIPGVPAPYDDADGYLWNNVVFSRVFDASVFGLPGNANIDGISFDGNLVYISFARNGGTNIPGLGIVQDEDVVVLNPGDGQWEIFFDGSGDCNLGLNNGQDVDAVNIANGNLLFSTIGNNAVDGVAGPYDDADIYSWDGEACTRVFDASASGLPGNADLDGLTNDGVNGYMTFNRDAGTNIPGLGVVQDEDVVMFDPVSATWTLFFDGSTHGLGAANAQDLDAILVQ